LRDPERRRALAEDIDRGPMPAELEELLGRARQCTEARDAIAILRDAVAKFPDFVPARVLLVRNLVSIQSTAEAITLTKELCASDPTSIPAWLMLAEILMGSYEYPSALEAISRAKAADTNDRRPVLLEAMMLQQQEKFDAALEKLGDALKLPDRRFVSNATLVGHRVLMQTERGHNTAMQSELELLVQQAGEDVEKKAETASLMVQLAGIVLAKGRPLLAREILARVERLAPERTPIDVSPPREVRLFELADETVRAIEANVKQPSASTLVLSGQGHLAPIALLIGSSVLLLACLAAMLGGAISGLVLITMLFCGGGIVSAVGMLGRYRGEGYLEVRPFHLVEVTGRQARIIPLLALIGARQLSGRVELSFEEGVAPVELDGSSELIRLIQKGLGQRSRLLSLMASDLIETEQHLEPLSWVSRAL
jgi:tetratricopeptide (TPR) repeat protein